MKLLQHSHSIRHKLNVILVATTFLALTLAGLGLVVLDLRTQARGIRSDLVAQADIVALASSAALAFDDAKAGAENLSVLRANPAVAAAALYRADGSRFALFMADANAALPAVRGRWPATDIDGEWIRVLRTVRTEGDPLGSVYLQARHNLVGRALEHFAVLLVILAASLGGALLLAHRLQRSVTEPILDVRGVAQRIMKGDFRLRARKTTQDEIGDLVDAFNAMVDELDRRAVTLERAEAVLRDSNRAKDEFIATLAHELRNPLAPIRTGLEIMKLDPEHGPASQRARQTMERQLVHMIRLIDDLLDISRITSGKIRIEPQRMRLASAIDSALEISRPAIEAGGHRLTVDMPDPAIELDADPTRLAQCVGNLLNNAAKYTPRGGAIALKVRREGGHAVIEVQDDGVGIPPDMLEQVFSMFAQVGKNLDRAQGGLGIGLSLVRSLVQLHGGTVTASSAGPGKGSTFTIRIPCLPAQAPAAAFAPAHPPTETHTVANGNGSRILVVDDNVDAADTLAAVLEISGHPTRTVHEPRAVLAAAAEFQPDVVLLDIGMPGLTGHEVAQQLRADPRFANTTLIAVTGWGAEADRERSREAGFDHHLTKPVDVEAVLELLKKPAETAA